MSLLRFGKLIISILSKFPPAFLIIVTVGLLLLIGLAIKRIFF